MLLRPLQVLTLDSQVRTYIPWITWSTGDGKLIFREVSTHREISDISALGKVLDKKLWAILSPMVKVALQPIDIEMDFVRLLDYVHGDDPLFKEHVSGLPVIFSAYPTIVWKSVKHGEIRFTLFADDRPVGNVPDPRISGKVLNKSSLKPFLKALRS